MLSLNAYSTIDFKCWNNKIYLKNLAEVIHYQCEILPRSCSRIKFPTLLTLTIHWWIYFDRNLTREDPNFCHIGYHDCGEWLHSVNPLEYGDQIRNITYRKLKRSLRIPAVIYSVLYPLITSGFISFGIGIADTWGLIKCKIVPKVWVCFNSCALMLPYILPTVSLCGNHSNRFWPDLPICCHFALTFISLRKLVVVICQVHFYSTHCTKSRCVLDLKCFQRNHSKAHEWILSLVHYVSRCFDLVVYLIGEHPDPWTNKKRLYSVLTVLTIRSIFLRNYESWQ